MAVQLDVVKKGTTEVVVSGDPVKGVKLVLAPGTDVAEGDYEVYFHDETGLQDDSERTPVGAFTVPATA
ncbi:hypothetical protein [Lentilactobacillus senioris]|uniref:hypothetical protein n=1 Tax=Lentilactobacillus senioris TaxID=931534 RepID=UPI003D2E61B8